MPNSTVADKIENNAASNAGCKVDRLATHGLEKQAPGSPALLTRGFMKIS
jgi:hypothetical protein